jgi:biotin carboxylase
MDDDTRQNVFVLGLDDFQRGELETITNAQNKAFHQLLPPEVVTRPEEHGFTSLLERAREQLRSFEGSVDAIIAHWDFPSSVIAPILGCEFELACPDLEAVLACEHKYWSRVVQQQSIPEAVPAFVGFDPFDDRALDEIDLDYPFWIKPVKAHSSALGFKIESAEDFHDAIPAIRDGIRATGDPFNEVLAMADLPEWLSADSGNTCLAEQIVTGAQATVEGSMHQGEFNAHGIFDSPKDEKTGHFARYEYPATTLPDEVQERMVDLCERYLRHIGFDDACWNVEFMWDEDTDQLWVIEINTRISQSHSDLFAKVDGMSNHEVAVAVAVGQQPWMPKGRGNFEVAAKCFLWTEEITDGIVRRVPSQQDIDRVVQEFPETHVQIEVEEGDRLSELRDQSSYRYDLGFLFLGAQDHRDIEKNYERCRQLLPFEIEPIEQ